MIGALRGVEARASDASGQQHLACVTYYDVYRVCYNMCMCMYVYIYIYIYVYTHLCIYI